jgi:molybdate transport system substrate-binding protein
MRNGRDLCHSTFPFPFCIPVFVFFAIALALAGCKRADTARQPLKVAAAADLAFAFKDVGDAFEKKTGKKVTFSFGSTGLLAKQIAEGAPFDVFAAANVSFVDDVVKAGACYDDARSMYARGRIVMWVPKGDAPATVGALADARWAKIAIANPEHAPYGKAAQDAMTSAGVWDTVKPRVVFGENVQQTLQYAQSGNVDVAVVALSLASVSGGAFTPVPPELHAPIDQALVVCKGSATNAAGAPNAANGSTARAFTAFVASPDGRAIMKRYGFLLPSESLAGPAPNAGAKTK